MAGWDGAGGDSNNNVNGVVAKDPNGHDGTNGVSLIANLFFLACVAAAVAVAVVLIRNGNGRGKGDQKNKSGKNPFVKRIGAPSWTESELARKEFSAVV